MSPPVTPSRGGNTTLMLILIGVSAINPVAINMFVPAMPDMIRSLGTDLPSIQLVLSAYLFSTAVAQLVLGPLSDRFGRRPTLIAGLVVFVIASIGCALAPNVGVLVAMRIAQGAGGCAGIVISRAVVRDRYDRDQAAAALGYVTMGFAVAPMLSPTIGGLLNDNIGWPSIFVLQAVLGAIVLLACVFALPETRRKPDPGEAANRFLTSMGALLRIPAFWSYALTLSFGVAVFFAFLAGTPVIASELLGMSGTEFGLFFALVPGGYILGNFVTARFSRRLGISVLMISGTTIVVVAVIAMGIAFGVGWYHPLSLFAPMYAIGFANGLTFSNAIAGAVSLRPQYAGAASGLAGSLQIMGGAVASVLIGVLLEAAHSVFTLVAFLLVLALASLAAAMWARSARG